MSRLVVVSNRLPVFPGRGSTFDLPAGGLVSVLFDALCSRHGGGLWLGWNDSARGSLRPRRSAFGGVGLVGIGLPAAEIDGYYHGFCNQALWPILHCFPGRAHFDLGHLGHYRSVQERFVQALLRELRPDDQVWIHDYHLLLVPESLRRLGFRGRIGYFFHTPFPPADLWALLPDAEQLLGGVARADLIGFQTRGDLENFAGSQRRLLGPGRRASARDRGSPKLGVFPVGIEPRDFEPSPAVERRPKSQSHLVGLIGGRRAVLGVDRLDYSKGLVERFLAFARFLERQPEWRRRVCLVQIASPSRGGLDWYRREREELEQVVGRINGELAEVDWTPIRYLHRSFQRDTLARLYRGADVGLVTPLRDGMNLVAKEFVAAQRNSDPGVLVLSRFAGASASMRDAILVNPYVIDETAAAIG
ncbi:MAG: trehalose-6-phosphate synthase, partial [Thermoanaerobaculia bacterium]|nr:trehalose-6-phosphate synthase [Thermoanaerobaculia bacterium]